MSGGIQHQPKLNQLAKHPPVDPRMYELALDNDRYVRLKRLAWEEGLRRLEQDPGSVPDTNLFQFIKETMRLDLAMQRPEAEAAKAKARNVLNIINLGGLPDDRKKALLVQAYELNAGDERDAVRLALEEIVGPAEAGRLLAIEGSE